MKRIIIILILLFVAFSGAFAAEKKLASAYITDGIADFDSGNYMGAILNLRSAEQLSPVPGIVYKYLGMAYGKLSLWQQAALAMNKVLFVSPDDPERADIVQEIRDWEGTKEFVPMMATYTFYRIKFKNRIWAEPDNLLNYLSLAEIFKCSGRYEEAENFFSALVKNRPAQTNFKRYLAEAYYLEGKYSEAGNLYKKILDEEPLNTGAVIGYNMVLKKRYENTLASQPGNILLYIKIARVLKEMKRYEDAVATYEKYLERDSANVEVNMELDETKKILDAISPRPPEVQEAPAQVPLINPLVH
jgi:tetratricopeptide (TPR) repeat protein